MKREKTHPAGSIRWFRAIIERILAGENPRQIALDHGFEECDWDVFDRLGMLITLKDKAKQLKRLHSFDAAYDLMFTYEKYETLDNEANEVLMIGDGSQASSENIPKESKPKKHESRKRGGERKA